MLAILVCLASLGYLGLRVLDHSLENQLVQAAQYRTTAVTVIKKDVVLFDEKNQSYVTDFGAHVKKRPGERENRIYFYFDQFPGYSESFQNKLMQAERNRFTENRPHFWSFDDRRFGEINVGDKVIISFKAYSNGRIDMVHAEKVQP